MIFQLPTELLSLILEYLTDKNDQLSTQLVCYSWHGPAKRAFYKKVTIQELHDDINRQSKLTQFIQSLTRPSVHGRSGRIPSAGQYVKLLLIDLEIVLDPKFMPTVADYQLLAAATPNLEAINFPVTMFWNYFISANLNQYWIKLRTLPPFRLTPTTPTYQLDQFIFFHTSLTSLDIEYVYSGHPQQLVNFTQMIRLFTNLEKIKITSNTLFFNQVVSILAAACPKITKLVMITPAASPTVTSVSDDNYVHFLPNIPTLRHLDLNVSLITPQLIYIITKNLPDLQKLVLQHQQKEKNVSAGEMEHLIRFITTSLSQSSIQLFISTNEIIMLSKLFLMSTGSPPDKVAVNVIYDSRSSCTTNIPDLSYHHQQNTKDLHIRFQGSISAQIQHQQLPHMQLLKAHGALIEKLKIQLPLSLYQAEMKSDHPSEKASCIQTILIHYCPNLSNLHVTQCYFDISERFGLTERSNLSKLTLEKSTITSASLYHLSQQSVHLNYLVLDQCDFDGLINMPRSVIKSLSIINNTIAELRSDGDEDTAITVFEHGHNRTTHCYFSSQSRKITLAYNTQQGTSQKKINIQCWSMDQFRFNHISILLH